MTEYKTFLKRPFFTVIFSVRAEATAVWMCPFFCGYSAGEMCVCWRRGGGVVSLSYDLSNPLHQPGSLLFILYFVFIFLSSFLFPPSTPHHFMSAFLVSFCAFYLFFVAFLFPPLFILTALCLPPTLRTAIVASCIASLHKMEMTSFPIKREVSSLHPYSRRTAILDNTLFFLCHRTPQ